VLELIIAKRLTELAEEHQLLPSNQFAKKGSSTVDAIRLIVEIIERAWKKNKIVSMMSLDLASAFPKINYQRLLDNLKKKGILTKIVTFIESFLSNRRTRLVIPGFESDWKEASNGIP
jgi:Reverse transcriptase (RNA-dependent DNA polymerase)